MREPRVHDEALLFELALDCPDADSRRVLLDRECQGQPELRRRIEALLAADEKCKSVGTGRPSTAGTAGAWAEVLGPAGRDDGAEEFEGRYRLLGTLGEGGFGTVYRAEQFQPVRREVALKVIKPGMDSRKVIGRFELERQTLAMMNHPNIARVLDAGTTGAGRPYFVMEFVPGERITTHCDARRLAIPARLRLAIQVCQAIQHAHQKGIIHRDIKPSNVLVAEQDGQAIPKVIDFGIAKAVAATGDAAELAGFTETHQFVGTPAYVSPEQAADDQRDIDTRSDIYSFGVLLYELLSGRPPFEVTRSGNRSPEAFRREIREREAVAPSVRLRGLSPAERSEVATARGVTPDALLQALVGDLDWIVLKCLEKDRNRRYETANGLAMDLQRFLANEPVVARPPSAAYKFGKFARRNRFAIGSAFAVLMALLVGIGVSTSQAIRARRAEAEQGRLLSKSRESQAQAERAENEALRQAQESRRLLYFSNLSLAQQYFEAGDRDRLSDLLLATRNDPHRGFERLFLARVANLDDRTVRASLPDIRSAAISFDGHWGAFGSAAGGVELCDLTTTNRWILREQGSSAVLTLAFSPDNQGLLGLDELARCVLWSTKTREPEWRFECSRSPRCAAFNPDGQRLILGGEGGTIEVWDVRARRRLRAFAGHQDWVFSVAFSPNGRQVATASWDRTIRLWDLETWDLQATLRGHAEGVLSVAYSPDGQQLLSGGFGGEVHRWPLPSTSPSPSWIGHGDLVRVVCFLPAAGWVASAGGDRAIRIWNPATQSTLQTLGGHAGEVETLRPFGQNGSGLISGAHDGTIKIWNLAEAVEVPEFGRAVSASGYSDWRTYLAVSPDGRQLVHGNLENPPEVWDSMNRRRTQRFVGHGASFVSSAAYSPDGNRVVTGSHDSTARIWEAASGKELAVLAGHSHYVSAVDWARRAPWIATASLDHTVGVWEADTDRPATILRGHVGAVRSVAISPTGRWIASASEDKTARLWDRLSGQVSRVWSHPSAWFTSVAIAPDESRVAAGLGDGTLYIWELASGRELLHLKTPFATVWEIRFSPDSSRFLTVGNERTAQLRDTETGHELLVLRGGKAAILHADFDAAGSCIIASCNDGACRIWRAISPERLHAWLQSF